jgi:hypothetical protein
MQRQFRCSRLRRAINLLLRAIHIMATAERTYFDQPKKISALCNYALYLLAVEHNHDRARPLVERMMEYMTKRGPDNAFILYTYAHSNTHGHSECTRSHLL